MILLPVPYLHSLILNRLGPTCCEDAMEVKSVTMKGRGEACGKCIPIQANGQARLYLGLERHTEMDGMKANGYDLDDWSQHLLETLG